MNTDNLKAKDYPYYKKPVTIDTIEKGKLEELEKKIAVKLVDVSIASRDNPKSVPIPRVLCEIMDLFRTLLSQAREEERKWFKEIVKANMQTKEEAEVAQSIGCDTNCVLDGICNVIDNTKLSTLASEEKEKYMKYRKKPVVIEAEQWKEPQGNHPLGEPDRLGVYAEGNTFYINTLEGRHIVTPNDWIITGVKGETYPCKPDIFEKTYEKV